MTEHFWKGMHPMNQICKEDKKIVWDPKLTEINTFHQSQEDSVPYVVYRHSARDFGGRSNVLQRPEISKQSTSCLNCRVIIRGSSSISDRDTRKRTRALSDICGWTARSPLLQSTIVREDARCPRIPVVQRWSLVNRNFSHIRNGRC